MIFGSWKQVGSGIFRGTVGILGGGGWTGGVVTGGCCGNIKDTNSLGSCGDRTRIFGSHKELGGGIGAGRPREGRAIRGKIGSVGVGANSFDDGFSRRKWP